MVTFLPKGADYLTYSTIILNCPHCGAALSLEQKVCNWCDSPVIITSLNSVFEKSDNEIKKYISEYKKIPNAQITDFSNGICYLKLKLYKQALKYFETAIDTSSTEPDIFFYAAVCCLNGQKAFLAKRADIDKAQEYLKAAISIEPKGIYYYLYAYIKYDYYERKSLNTNPNYKELLFKANHYTVTEYDKMILNELLNIITEI